MPVTGRTFRCDTGEWRELINATAQNHRLLKPTIPASRQDDSAQEQCWSHQPRPQQKPSSSISSSHLPRASGTRSADAPNGPHKKALHLWPHNLRHQDHAAAVPGAKCWFCPLPVPRANRLHAALCAKDLPWSSGPTIGDPTSTKIATTSQDRDPFQTGRALVGSRMLRPIWIRNPRYSTLYIHFLSIPTWLQWPC